MLLLDVVIRYPAVTILLVLAYFGFREGWKNKPTLYAALVAITVAALLLGTSHPVLKFPTIPHMIFRIIDVPSVAFVWWFGRSLFEDDFELGIFEWSGMALIVFPNTMFRLSEFGIIANMPMALEYFDTIVTVLLMLHLMYVAISGRQDDVIETRRRARFYYVIGAVVATILIVLSDRLFGPAYAIELSIFRSALILPLAVASLFWLTRFHPEHLTFQTIRSRILAKPEMDPRDHPLHTALVAHMRDDLAYTEPGLTIRALAENLSTPEHRLRQLINKGMGYRNFSDFLNQYRIEAVKQAMHLPKNARIPVLTLAMDVGFNSLAPFNRAFRAITGETPTEYRSKTLNKNND